jgi:hypothetical protein
MSYFPNYTAQTLINPDALCVCSATNNTSSAVGSDVQFSAANDFIGSLASSLSFSSGVITLPAGYYYFLEGSTQTYNSSSLNTTATYCEYQWHDGTTGQGTHGRTAMNPYTDQQLTGRDEKALVLVDATAGAVSYSLQVTSVNRVDASGLNSTVLHYIYAGMGRAIIWRLDP